MEQNNNYYPSSGGNSQNNQNPYRNNSGYGYYQNSGYGQEPDHSNWAQPQQSPPPNKNNRGLIIGLSILGAVLVVAGIIITVILLNNNKEKNTIEVQDPPKDAPGISETIEEEDPEEPVNPGPGGVDKPTGELPPPTNSYPGGPEDPPTGPGGGYDPGVPSGPGGEMAQKGSITFNGETQQADYATCEDRGSYKTASLSTRDWTLVAQSDGVVSAADENFEVYAASDQRVNFSGSTWSGSGALEHLDEPGKSLKYEFTITC